MENKEPKIDYKKLTPEERDKLELYTMNVQKTRKLEDIATLMQELIYMGDELQEKSAEATKSMGALFVDIREMIKELVGKKNPQYDDKKVVEALQELDRNLMEAVKGLDVAPQVHVEAPEVTVQAPKVDLSGVKKATEEGYKAVAEAIANIPPVELPAYPDRWDDVLAQLQSIDTASRLKPEFPNVLKVTNVDGSSIGATGLTDAELRDTPLEVTLTPKEMLLLRAIANPSYVDKTANQMRAQVTGTITTVTTVTTVTGLTNIDGYQGKLVPIAVNLDAWANTVRRNIT